MRGYPMFNLEPSISEWRRQMLVAGIKSPVPLEELEAHLREEIERQVMSGIHEQMAFSNAVGMMGNAEPLKEQFKRAQAVDISKQRKFAANFYSAVLMFYVLATIYAMTRNNLSVFEWCLGIAAQLALLALSWVCWRQVPIWSSAMSNRSLQSAVGLMGGISGAIWFLAFAYFILPHCDFTTGELMVALSWAMVPTLILPEAAFLLLDKSEGEELRIN
jgi:uncharacterized membrane protein YeiB